MEQVCLLVCVIFAMQHRFMRRCFMRRDIWQRRVLIMWTGFLEFVKMLDGTVVSFIPFFFKAVPLHESVSFEIDYMYGTYTQVHPAAFSSPGKGR